MNKDQIWMSWTAHPEEVYRQVQRGTLYFTQEAGGETKASFQLREGTRWSPQSQHTISTASPVTGNHLHDSSAKDGISEKADLLWAGFLCNDFL